MIILFLFFIICFQSTSTFAQISIPGGNVSGTWTLTGSPYYIQGSIMIPNDSLLTIEPGVTAIFQGTYKLLVLGRLLAIGNSSDTITFTASNTTTGWRGIRFLNTTNNNDTSKFIYCKFQYGKATGVIPDDVGGAFYFSNFSKAIISHCSIINCFANSYGGGIYCSNSSPNISYNNISYNSCDNWYGGGICCQDNSYPLISRNIISYNYSNNNNGYGGGIYCDYSSNTLITANKIIGNNNGYGGGIGCNTCTISNDTIAYNSSYYSGGGVNCGNCTINSSVICNNSANIVYGGGVYCDNCTITNCIISNNSANDGTNGSGGGIICDNCTITNTSITNNSATYGGALSCEYNSIPTFRNCILWGNSATVSGPQVYLNDEASDPQFYYCNIQDGSSGFSLNGNFYTGTYQNNIDTDPQFVAPSGGSGTGFNGITADWSIQMSSPSINAGDPSGNYPPNDIAGNPRVVSDTIDIGAYEYQGIVSISEFIVKNDFFINKNPSKGNFVIKISDTKSIGGAMDVDIFTLFGEKIYSIKSNGQVALNIDISHLSKGMYIIKFYDSEKIHNEKIILE